MARDRLQCAIPVHIAADIVSEPLATMAASHDPIVLGRSRVDRGQAGNRQPYDGRVLHRITTRR